MKPQSEKYILIITGYVSAMVRFEVDIIGNCETRYARAQS